MLPLATALNCLTPAARACAATVAAKCSLASWPPAPLAAAYGMRAYVAHLAALVDEKNAQLAALRRLMKVTPVNTVAMRRRLADATAAKGGYVFS